MASDQDFEGETISASSLDAAVRATSPEESRALLAGRYEILGMLGAGAMGTVYRARDTELDEIVALKVLKKEIASLDMLERFRREVKLARRVTHKNVARTFDIGEHGGDRFLTMELVQGEMLGSLLGRKGRLPIADVVRLATDVCAGLAAAHAAGVLHRDLKPENVIVAKDGRAVITDFGIARAATEGELSRTVGGLVGTPAYMAPEQVEGASDLDARADLYALGTMLFELLTGTLAWNGDSIVTVAAGRLLRPPPDVRSIVPTLPAPIAEVVLKLMARRREDRFASADETAAALLAASTEVHSIAPVSPRSIPRAAPSGTLALGIDARTRSTPGARVVAVLPVLNLGVSDDAYLVDNVNEDVVDLLSMVPGILVRPRGETARFVASTRDVREIGRTLGADVVVDGSLRRLGETVRASFRLIAVEDGFQLWARRFDRPPAQVLSIADDAAHAIALALTSELKAPAAVRPVDPAAEELFLRGRYLMRHGSPREAVDVLARANERTPDDPRILGVCALSLARAYGGEPSREDADRARAMAARALELDPTQPEAKIALGTVHLQNGEADAAIAYFRAALATAPTSVDALDWLGRIATEVGRRDDGIAWLERACALDPEYLAARQQLARIHAMMGDREGMLRYLGEVPLVLGDITGWFMIQLRYVLWYGDKEHGLRLDRLLATMTTLPPASRFGIGGILDVALGREHKLHDAVLLDRLLPVDASRPPRRAAFNAQLRAEMMASIGSKTGTLDALKASDDSGLFDVGWLERCPLFASLRDDPDFVAVARRVTLRAQRIAAALDARQSQVLR